MPLSHILEQPALGPNSAHVEVSIYNCLELSGNEKKYIKLFRILWGRKQVGAYCLK